MKKKLCYVLFLLLIGNHIVKGQDIQFSQFYANPLYLNPAFAGSVHQSRVILHQRVQWPSLEAKYITSFLSVDHFFSKINSGLGFYVYRDWQGGNRISSTEAALQYSYELRVTPLYSFRAGFQASYFSRQANYQVLTWPDQFNNYGYNGLNTSEPFQGAQSRFLDFSFGGIMYSDKFWGGITYSHVTQPNQSFYGQDSRLPYKLTFIAGYKIFLQGSAKTQKEEISITPTAHYKMQGKSDQLDGGVYGLYHNYIIGGWYRGIPLLKQYRNTLQNNESIVLLAGYKYKSLSVSYSYDFTVSKLVRAVTGGSHEINLTYVFNWPPQKGPRYKRLPCPHFYK